MSEWSAGYVADIDYTYGYYDELNPQRIRLAFLKQGLRAPTIRTACELGFGQGMSVNLHAAASKVQWWGNDFNSTQASFAQELARTAGSAAQLTDQSFEEFCARDDLPEFDFIALHGVWSWISDRDRTHIMDLVRRKLAVGGVFYISYNTLTSWSAFVPLRNLMMQHTRSQSAMGLPIAERIQSAMEFAKSLLDTEPTYSRVHPVVKERLKNIFEQRSEYLAHEYFNENWSPMDFKDIADWLEPAKLEFACSATFFEHINTLILNPQQRAIVNDIKDPVFRESTWDMLTNQQFRRDYWVKGPRRLSTIEQAETFRDMKVVLVRPFKQIKYKVKTSIGEADLNEPIYKPITEAMKHNEVIEVSALEEMAKTKDISLPQLLEALMVMVGAGYVQLAADEESQASVADSVANINHYINGHARGSNDIKHMASPVTGGGVPVDRFESIFIEARKAGMKTPDKWAQHAVKLLMDQGQLMVQEGKTLKTEEENLEAMRRAAGNFAEVRLGLLEKLGVA